MHSTISFLPCFLPLEYFMPQTQWGFEHNVSEKILIFWTGREWLQPTCEQQLRHCNAKFPCVGDSHHKELCAFMLLLKIEMWSFLQPVPNSVTPKQFMILTASFLQKYSDGFLGTLGYNCHLIRFQRPAFILSFIIYLFLQSARLSIRH